MKKYIFYILIFTVFACSQEKKQEAITLNGNALGTTFNIKYFDTDNVNYLKKVDSIINAVNRSLSTYHKDSDISKINRGDSTIVVDELFLENIEKSRKIHMKTNGFFDPTIGILVNAWGFGPEMKIDDLDSTKVADLLKYVGFEKIQIKNGKVIKESEEIYLDFNSIAKGYTIDLIGRYLETKGINDYLVELGGEVRARGKNLDKGALWSIAIEDPNTDGTRSFTKFVKLNNESMATSGNYRKFKKNKNGEKFVHTVNPKTGFAYESDLISATVISEIDCADVDAYATAFMAMGLENTKEFLKNNPEIKAFLIYVDENENLTNFTSPTLKIHEIK
ncbi:FAD:protein FMN transferase [Aureivirga sp. CE67]|uniref:FAD:protein FMN transferase n=1 Tax=Aureivirga sp. CE67 TaxID=1788983 RepID=UPI0018CA1D5B|nr:FAD:protein FMN transferase [Aureivirga sp. CE67]